jgi:branched-chain amino acid transport system ATP-binding protein
VLLVDQNARAALAIADRGYVMETGRIVLQGVAAELLRDPQVQQAYLGH